MPRGCYWPPFEQRFWAKVEKSDTDGCWEWKGCHDSFGYGQIARDGQQIGAHRASWGVHYGPVPAGKCVLHSCDNPGCVNPNHLFLGTKADNLEDMTTKGRRAVGESHGQVRYSAGVYLKIATESGTLAEIAKRHGICAATVSKLHTGSHWSQVSS